jgi:hypothetical protein
MKAKQIVFVLLVVWSFLLTGCGIGGSSGNGSNGSADTTAVLKDAKL